MPVEMATHLLKADRAAISAAARVLGSGGLVAFPTETVYGLGADATNGAAVARLYAAKGRPRFNPLIAHVANAGAALALARFSDDAKLLAGVFWPGPLTLVLPKADGCPVSELATAGPRLHRGAGAGSRHRNRPAQGIRQAGGGALGKPVRPCLADHRAARARRPRRAHRPDHRWRSRQCPASSPPSCRASARRCCCVRGGCRATRSNAYWGTRSAIRNRPRKMLPLAPGMLASH
jgi:hypothetical protein